MTLHRLIPAVAALLLAAFPFQGASAEGDLNIYSARHYDSDLLLYQAFAEETGIDVHVIEDSAGSLIARIKAEGANSPADVFLTADAGNLAAAADEGLFQSVSSELLEARIPARLREPDGLWFGLTQRSRIIIYRKDDIDVTGLEDYEDLADPAWDDMICIRTSGNVYNQSLVGSLIAADGEEATAAWIRGLVANFARDPEGNDTAQIRAVAAGECDIAVVNTYYLARLARSDDPADRAVAEAVGVVLPNQSNRGTHTNISGAGVLAHAPNRDNAVRFIEFLASDEAQAIFAEANNEWPAVEGLGHAEVLDALYGDFKRDPVNAAVFGANRGRALSLMEANGWM